MSGIALASFRTAATRAAPASWASRLKTVRGNGPHSHRGWVRRTLRGV